MTPLIALDLDGVFAEFNRPAAHQLGVTPDWDTAPSTWDWMAQVATPEAIRRFWQFVTPLTSAVYDPANEFWHSLPKHRDCTERVLTLLDSLQDQMTVVTARPSQAHEVTASWMARHLHLGAWVPLHLVPNPPKAYAYHALGATHVVEDCRAHALDLYAINQAVQVYLVDRPYNQGPLPPSAVRCASTEDALQRIEDALTREAE